MPLKKSRDAGVAGANNRNKIPLEIPPCTRPCIKNAFVVQYVHYPRSVTLLEMEYILRGKPWFVAQINIAMYR